MASVRGVRNIALMAVIGVSAACQALVGIEDTTTGEEGAGGSGGQAGATTGGTGGSGGSGGSGGVAGSGGSGGVAGSGGSGGDASVDADLDGRVVVDCDGGVVDDASVTICPGNVMYVSDGSGSDSNSGCSPCFPKLTLSGALDAIAAATGAGANLPSGFALHVCEGEYVEVGLVLDQPVSLHGGYDCATWSRTADYGWPTFDKLNDTIVRNGNPSTQPDSLRVTGALVDASVTIEGFTFRGWESAAPVVNAKALGVYAGATPTLMNDFIEGGASKAFGSGGGLTNVASAGLWIEDASPDVFHNQIHGGSGSDADYGSVGVLIRGASAAPKLHQNEIHGGSGNGQDDGSVGVRVIQGATLTVAGGNPITENDIWGGTGIDGSLFGGSAVGVVLETPAELVFNRIHGETYSAPNGMLMGVRVQGTAVVARNRIHPGANTGGTSNSVGVMVQGAGARIENNMIHSGSAGYQAGGVWLKNASGVSLLHNTIYTGTQPATPTELSSLFLDTATTTTIRGNLLLANADELVPGIAAIDCLNTSMISALHDNAFIGFDSLADLADSQCPGTVTSIGSLQSPITSQGTAGGNVRYKAPGTCGGGETGCLELAACPGTAGSTTQCMTTLFTTWSAPDDGVSTLGTDGWMLKPNSAPCTLAKAVTTASVSVDLYGATRTSLFARGAHEFDGSCN
jgi:hypothetical protein